MRGRPPVLNVVVARVAAGENLQASVGGASLGWLAPLELRDLHVASRSGEPLLDVARVASDRILAETDSPYLAPQPVRGQPNEPRYVLHTLATLAAARVEDPHELERRIDENATSAFGLGAP